LLKLELTEGLLLDDVEASIGKMALLKAAGIGISLDDYGILTLADSVGLSAIAEGVESVEQKNYLARQGCRAIQGYLFGPPLPVAEFEALLPEQRARA
jgi:EAL domain-containing protein (putative c-di-GMP-specific phosphodiesterase class I)